VVARQVGLCRYEVAFDLRGAGLPAPLSRMGQQAMMQRLQSVRQQAEEDYQAEKKIMATLTHHHHLEEQLQDAQAAAEQARGEAARLAGKGEDADKEYHAALMADEKVKSLQTALARARTPDDVRSGLVSRLEHNLQAEAERIRTEVLARQATARERLALAVKGLLLEVALADADALLVQQATPAQKAVFGAAAGWLDNQVATMVPSHLRPRSIQENHRAPVPSRTY
jgi:hypothetical protein